ncbi:MAG: hypothetical protein IT287_05910 [Bdellovibrionaceae bacterium]|nr:hypothetical protein [Pseudobdellovibrionaceae bacterium]
MKKVLEQLVASLSFLLVFCLHVYFVLLVGTKPAFAAEAEVAKEAVIKAGVFGAEKPVIKKEIVIKDAAGNAVVETTTEEVSADDEDDGGISIKINGQDGIAIKGSEKLLEKLQKFEDKIEAKLDEREDVVESSIGKTLENVLVPIMIFLISFGFAGYVVYSKQRTRKEYLETIRALAQNNQPIPQELLANLNSSSSMDFNNKIKNMNYGDPGAVHGMKYLFIGGGIVAFMLLVELSVPAAFGSIFLTIGGYHMFKSHLLQKQAEAKKAEAAMSPAATTGATETAMASGATQEKTNTNPPL